MSDSDTWSRLIVEVADRPAASELLGAVLFELGAQGLETQDSSTLPSPELNALEAGNARLIAFFEGLPEALAQVRADLATRAEALGLELHTLTLEPFTDTSWRDGWKAFFQPDRVSNRIGVRPPWETWDAPEGVHVLVIEPGMAFGTGLHETTRLCLRILDELTAQSAPPDRMLDVGCGSGVLTMAARKLGVPHVLGLDVDPIAVEVSADNADLNGISSGCTFATTPVDALDGSYPLVVANILAHILRRLRNALIARTRAGGVLILSGLLERERDAMLDAFCASGEMSLEREATLGEWIALVLRKKA